MHPDVRDRYAAVSLDPDAIDLEPVHHQAADGTWLVTLELDELLVLLILSNLAIRLTGDIDMPPRRPPTKPLGELNSRERSEASAVIGAVLSRGTDAFDDRDVGDPRADLEARNAVERYPTVTLAEMLVAAALATGHSDRISRFGWLCVRFAREERQKIADRYEVDLGEVQSQILSQIYAEI